MDLGSKIAVCCRIIAPFLIYDNSGIQLQGGACIQGCFCNVEPRQSSSGLLPSGRNGIRLMQWCGIFLFIYLFIFSEARPLPEQQNWLIFILAVNSSSSNYNYRLIRLFRSISSRSNSTTGFYLLCNNWEPEAKQNKQHNVNKGENC